ncbi:membrane protein [Streptomyces gelaticus]|uniref:Membrane protein n=1 Tax=Streptomyces gelaticus TaxID=285446 RepID=A0ABQ2W8E0_9ACTN|nr:peptidoglycan-binding protein [Streptomyces gelaticus]GGV93293.1 membrane protein [Streptomyces gelaticus]
MTVPAFEEYVPAVDCTCAGCVAQRRTAASALPVRYGGHPAAHGARRALVLATAAGVVLGSGVAEAAGPTGDRAAEAAGAARADREGDSPQGGPGPLRGAGAAGPPSSTTTTPKLRKTSRADIIKRAKKWVSAEVPYSMVKYWSDGYRQDCSGFVSMAWNLPGNEWTGSLAAFGTRIARADLQPGDILLFHNPADPSKGSHVTIFGGWTDSTHTHYTAYEQTKPHTRKKTTPMAYWSNSGSYVAYRYKGLSSGSAGSGSSVPGFPGTGKFGPGASNKYVTQLGRMLVDRGGRRFYEVGPGPGWGDADRRATRAFQKAQGWKGEEADGIPGPDTWQLLAAGTGRDIPGTGSGSGGGGTGAGHGDPGPDSKFPGRGYFRPGQSNGHVERLGKQLVKKGFGKHYTSGPGPRWTEADRRNVEAFQRAQGWRGGAADGYPGPETWRRLFG